MSDATDQPGGVAELAVDATWRPPYAPSWIDRLTTWIADRPVPEPVTYVGIGLTVVLLLSLAAWLSGTVEVGTVTEIHLLVGLFAGALPWLVRRFNVLAQRGFEALRPVLIVDDDERATLRFRLANLPAVPTLVVGVVVSLAAMSRIATTPSTLQALRIASEPVPLMVAAVVLVAFAFIGSSVLCKAIYQAWLIHRITTRDVRVGLFEIGALYAFANLTAFMAISLVIIGLVSYFAEPGFVQGYDPIGLASLIFGVGLAAAVFALPLVGVHNRLVAEKERLKTATRAEFAIALTELHRVIETNELAAMDPLNKAIASLDLEYRGIVDAPTWPWRSETFRWVVGVLMIPFLLFILQQVVPRLMP